MPIPMPHSVKVTHSPGTSEERISENVPAFLQAESSFFKLEPRLKKGDLLECADYFDEPMVVASVQRNDGGGIASSLSHQAVKVKTRGEWAASNQPRNEPGSVTQNFHGSVGLVAGRDNNISISVVLEALADKVSTDPSVPDAERKGLAERIRAIARNPYVVAVTTGVVTDLIRRSTGG